MDKFLRYVLVLLVLVFFVNDLSAQVDTNFNGGVTDGDGFVEEIAVQTDGKIIVVGSFFRVTGSPRNNIARLNTDGTLDASFNIGSGSDAEISAVILQTDGKIIIGGRFNSFNGQSVSKLARLNADGSLDTGFTQAGIDGEVNDLFLYPDGKILVAGNFVVPVRCLLRLNSNGSTDTTFTSPQDVDTAIITIALQSDNKILIGGEFSSFNGTSRQKIARLNANGGLDSSFDTSLGFDSTVNKIIVQSNGKIVVSGNFLIYGNIGASGLIRLNNDSSVDTAFQINFPNSVSVNGLFVQPDGKIVAGIFNSTTLIGEVSRFNLNGSKDLSFSSGDTDYLQARDIKPQADGKLLIGGDFVAFNNQPKIRIVRTSIDGVTDNSFNSTITSPAVVNVIKQQNDGKILIGGDFEYAGDVRRSSVARLNVDGTTDASFVMPFDFVGTVADLAVQNDGKILVAGSFTTITSPRLRGLIRLNIDGSLDTTFNAVATVSANTINIQTDGKIIVSGNNVITTPPFAVLPLVRLNSNGALDNTFNPIQPRPGTIRAVLIQPDSKILIGGVFTPGQGGLQRTGLARYNADGTLDASFTGSTSANSQVNALAIQANGRIYIGGLFNLTVDNVAYRNAARLDADGKFEATYNTQTSTNQAVRTIALQNDGKLILGGIFTNYKGISANRIVRTNADGTFDSTFITGTGATNDVQALNVQTDGKVLVGGKFLSFNNVAKFSLVRLLGPIRRLFDFDGDGKSDISVFRPSNGTWYLQNSQAGFSAVNFGLAGDLPTPADYDGDGKTDISIFRNGIWYRLNSSDSTVSVISFGLVGDIPTPADFDGDGKADEAVYRQGIWYLNRSTAGFTAISFGLAGDKPVQADYDGDGKTDVAVYRNGIWYLLQSTNGFTAIQFGIATDTPVAADYDGDNKTDFAVYRSGIWYLLRSTQGFIATQFGISTDLPVPADYDGDGKTDVAVYRTGIWYLLQTTNGVSIQSFGLQTDKPIPASFIQ